MHTVAFDTLTRRAAAVRTRRSAPGVIVGAVLGSRTQSAGACSPGHDCNGSGGHKHKDGGKGHHGGDKDKKDDKKKDKKECRKQAKECLAAVAGGYCNTI